MENKIATKANLVRHGIAVENILCSLCREKEENSLHMFFGCRFTWLVWSLYYVWLGLKSVDSFNPHTHFLQFNLTMHQILSILSWGMSGLRGLVKSGVLGTRSSLKV